MLGATCRCDVGPIWRHTPGQAGSQDARLQLQNCCYGCHCAPACSYGWCSKTAAVCRLGLLMSIARQQCRCSCSSATTTGESWVQQHANVLDHCTPDEQPSLFQHCSSCNPYSHQLHHACCWQVPQLGVNRPHCKQRRASNASNASLPARAMWWHHSTVESTVLKHMQA